MKSKTKNIVGAILSIPLSIVFMPIVILIALIITIALPFVGIIGCIKNIIELNKKKKK